MCVPATRAGASLHAAGCAAGCAADCLLVLAVLRLLFLVLVAGSMPCPECHIRDLSVM